MIKRIYLDNYKSFANFDMPLSELVVLAGGNGVGKSAILDVVYALKRLLGSGSLVTHPECFPASTCTRWRTDSAQSVAVEVELSGSRFDYQLLIEHHEDRRKARIQRELLTCDGKPLFDFAGGEVQLYRDDFTPGPTFSSSRSESALARVPARSDNKKLTSFLDFMRSILVCGLYPRAFSAESQDESITLERDGANFASWFRHLVQEQQEHMTAYYTALNAVIPGLSALRMERVGVEARVLQAVFNASEDRFVLNLDELSDGQRALLALYALIYLSKGQSRAVFIDEPDNYLALREIQPWLSLLEEALGDGLTQVVLCSHHPEALNLLGASHGLVLERPQGRVTRVRAISSLDLTEVMSVSEIFARGWES